jgi:lipid-A-disaccharide synthase
MKYYIIAGEASGDLHGSGLIRALRRTDPGADFRFWGGDLMKEAGGTLVRHIEKTSFMGFWEVLRNIGSIYAGIRFCKKDIATYQPDALILIDYAGFNLRMARYAKKSGIRVFYYISPKVWAWNQSRVRIIKKYVDHMLTIFPFETEFYDRFGYRVDYVGNPLMDAIGNRPFRDEKYNDFISRNNLQSKPVIAVLAGSRIQEVEKSLPVMLSVAGDFPGYQFIIAGAPSIKPEVYQKIAGNRFAVLFNQTYAILQQSAAAIVVSGTATLETALLGTPLVVCYRGSFISYQIARRFVRIRYISLVNLIMNREVVKELIQDEFNGDNLKDELNKILNDSFSRDTMMDDFEELKKVVGSAGASERAAEKITRYLQIEQS